MKKTEFYKILANDLELNDDLVVNENTNLKDLPEFDSLSILTMVAILDEHFSLNLSSEKLENVQFVHELTNLIGDDKFQ